MDQNENILTGVIRFSEDIWRKRYGAAAYPEEALDLVGLAFGWKADVVPGPPDNIIHQMIIDDGYTEWLAGRPDTDENLCEYVTEHSDDDSCLDKENDKAYRITDRLYGLMVASEELDSRGEFTIRRETADEMERYLSRITGIGDYSVRVFPGMMRLSHFVGDSGHLMSMAKAWFNDGVNVSYGNMFSMPPGESGIYVLPFAIREFHGPITSGEVRDYINGYVSQRNGRLMNRVRLNPCGTYQVDYSPEGPTADSPEWLLGTKAMEMLNQDIGENIMSVFSFALPAQGAVEWVRDMQGDIAKRAGLLGRAYRSRLVIGAALKNMLERRKQRKDMTR